MKEVPPPHPEEKPHGELATACKLSFVLRVRYFSYSEHINGSLANLLGLIWLLGAGVRYQKLYQLQP